MKKLITCAVAGLLLVGGQSLFAQTATTNSTPSTPAAGEHKHANKEMLKTIGLTPADLKGLSKEDRQAKIKEAVQKTITDLKAKQTAGTITPEETANLDKLQNWHPGKKKATTDSQ